MRIISIPDETYAEVVNQLSGELEKANTQWRGTIYTKEGYSLDATLMIYKGEELLPEGRMTVIVDIVPIWWEFHTPENDEEFPNDFRLKEVIEQLIN